MGVPSSCGSGAVGRRGVLRVASARRGVAALAALVLLAWACPAAAQTRVAIGQGAPNTTGVALWMAAERGYFRKHGIEPDLRWIRGGTLTTAALLSGEIAFASMSLAQVVGPVTRGADLVVVASLVDRLAQPSGGGAPDRDPVDLRGRKVGIATLSGAAYVAARLALRQLGLDLARDRIALVQIGGEYSARRRPSRRGPSTPPCWPRALRPGFPCRPTAPWSTSAATGFPGNTRAWSPGWALLRSSPQLVDAVMRAVAEGAAFALDAGQKDAVKAVIGSQLRLTDPAALEDAYRDALEGVAWKPIPNPESGAGVLRLLAEFDVVEGAVGSAAGRHGSGSDAEAGPRGLSRPAPARSLTPPPTTPTRQRARPGARPSAKVAFSVTRRSAASSARTSASHSRKWAVLRRDS